MNIDVSLVTRLVGARFPQWAHLPIRPVRPGGWDHRTFRLGDTMLVRLPSAERYAAQVEKEQRWLPVLAPHLPRSIPAPLAVGEPAAGYPWRWSVYRWIEGEAATVGAIDDAHRFAVDLAEFLGALRRIDTTGGPPPGAHNFFRGGPPSTYDAETRTAIDALRDVVDVREVTAVWETALDSAWEAPPVWVHGDVAAGNLLVRGGRLSAVIDFGSAGVGDPACDLAIAWTLFSGASRAAFRRAIDVDEATWARGRGWALWKALIQWHERRAANADEADRAAHVITEIVADAESER